MIHRVTNSISLDGNSIWVPDDRKHFAYSDGRSTEKYLQKVFQQVEDLSSTSFELERYMKDWPSEYHLSRKRAQLLRGFKFDKSKKVLEVGCGCGAITRFLGETFDDVVAVEGNMARADLARQRTMGFDNVSVVCAPFQELEFTERFDIIFCIGVFEYSGVFIEGENPYDSALQYFSDLLTPDGTVVIAIENQFGIKYFSSSREDHSSRMFDGIEGYRYGGNKARTFGYEELNRRLDKYFSNTDFYFPYPDYKIPSCILSEQFFSKVQAGELIGSIKSRDYYGEHKPLFDEYFSLLEIEKNNMLPFFSNSFLVFASNKHKAPLPSGILGWLFSSDRIESLQTVTHFVEQNDGSVWSQKSLLSGEGSSESGLLSLSGSENKWIDGKSLQTMIRNRVKENNISIGDLISPCTVWLEALKQLATSEGGRLMLEGQYFDHVWQNTYIVNGECLFIDNEWTWHEIIPLNLIVIRSIYLFLREISDLENLHPALKSSSSRAVIIRLAKSLGIKLRKADFSEFVRFESELRRIMFSIKPLRKILSIRLFLWNRRLLSRIEKMSRWLAIFRRKAGSLLLRLFELRRQ